MTKITNSVLQIPLARRIDGFAKPLFLELQAKKKEVADIENTIKQAFTETAPFKDLRRMAMSYSPYAAAHSEITIDSSDCKTTFRIVTEVPDDEVAQKPAKPALLTPTYSPLRNVPEKTLNLMLSGNILTVDEKRDMISSLTSGIVPPSTNNSLMDQIIGFLEELRDFHPTVIDGRAPDSQDTVDDLMPVEEFSNFQIDAKDLLKKMLNK